jgi:hypothetical protein
MMVLKIPLFPLLQHFKDDSYLIGQILYSEEVWETYLFYCFSQN